MRLSPTDWHPIIWIWLLSAAAFVALLFWTRKSDTPGAPAFRGLSLANIVYITAAALELATTNSTLWWWIAGIMHMASASSDHACSSYSRTSQGRITG
ncbi:MAG TPA: hypothetical protein PKN08_04385 [Opitutaceae bacterium]|nr:hypothetical protein [Opitutaceae bacterium]